MELLTLFGAEFARCGGPAIYPAELESHVLLFAATMGLAWLMYAPALVLRELPDPGASADRFDPLLRESETARTQLPMLTTVMRPWQTRRFGTFLDRMIGPGV